MSSFPGLPKPASSSSLRAFCTDCLSTMLSPTGLGKWPKTRIYPIFPCCKLAYGDSQLMSNNQITKSLCIEKKITSSIPWINQTTTGLRWDNAANVFHPGPPSKGPKLKPSGLSWQETSSIIIPCINSVVGDAYISNDSMRYMCVCVCVCSKTQVDPLASRKIREFPTQILNFFKSWEVPIFQTLSPHSPGYKTYLGISHNGSIISSVYQGMDPILATVGLRTILVHRPWHRRCSPASATKRLAVS